MFESALLCGPTLPLLRILRGGALPLRNVLAKFPLADPGSFMVGWRQWFGLMGSRRGLLSVAPSDASFYKFFDLSCCFFR